MPPSIRYMNQSAPFWDFIASMEEGDHPFFGGTSAPQASSSSWGPGPWGHRGGHPPWAHNLPHRGPPGPPGETDAPAAEDAASSSSPTAQPDDVNTDAKEGTPDPPEDTPREPADGCAGRRRCHGGGPGSRRWGGGGGRPARGFGPGPHHHHHHHNRHGAHHGPPGGGSGGPWGGFAAPGFRMLSGLFQPQEEGAGAGADGSNDFVPDVDVFDTAGAFVVHVSLPGAEKEAVGVTWDSERSELQVAGVVHRPGDEEFLKTLALDERRVGAFERKVRLGSMAHPAQVDVDGISAKLENGILVVEVPKMLGEFVDVKKVDVE